MVKILFFKIKTYENVTLQHELHLNESKNFRNFLRMKEPSSDELQDLIESYMRKEDAAMRPPIPSIVNLV